VIMIDATISILSLLQSLILVVLVSAFAWSSWIKQCHYPVRDELFSVRTYRRTEYNLWEAILAKGAHPLAPQDIPEEIYRRTYWTCSPGRHQARHFPVQASEIRYLPYDICKPHHILGDFLHRSMLWHSGNLELTVDWSLPDHDPLLAIQLVKSASTRLGSTLSKTLPYSLNLCSVFKRISFRSLCRVSSSSLDSRIDGLLFRSYMSKLSRSLSNILSSSCLWSSRRDCKNPKRR
jgi:hypothetical protein